MSKLGKRITDAIRRIKNKRARADLFFDDDARILIHLLLFHHHLSDPFSIMPVDPSHNPLNRRVNRKLTTDEEIDSRRARGEVSARLRFRIRQPSNPPALFAVINEDFMC